jgi:Spy/CpxP family protein refolding chaperone
MLNKILLVALTVSLAFNAAFVGTWASRRIGEHRRPPIAPRRAPWSALKLTPDQQQALHESWRQTGELIRALSAEAAAHRNALLDLMAAEKPEEQAVAAEQGKLAAVEEQMRLLVLDQMFQMRELLTPEQRAEWLRIMRARGEAGMWGGMYGGSRPMEAHSPDRGPRPVQGNPGRDNESRRR